MTVGKLIELALGREEAKHVDSAIPQHVFDRMTQAQRDDIAGWYYDRPDISERRSLMGRLLTQTECWTQIVFLAREGKMRATMLDHDLTFVVVEWPCFRRHAERDEIQLERLDGNG